MKFKMPTKSDLKGRTSTISNAFAISVTPYIVPSEEEVKKLYQELDIKEGQCAYCLGNGNCRDHLKPLAVFADDVVLGIGHSPANRIRADVKTDIVGGGRYSNNVFFHIFLRIFNESEIATTI